MTLVERLALESALARWARSIGRRWPSPTPEIYRITDHSKEPVMHDITEVAA